MEPIAENAVDKREEIKKSFVRVLTERSSGRI